MRLFPRLLTVSLTTLLAGCNNSGPTSTTSPSPAAQAAASYVISGIVAETVDGTSRPLVDAFVGLQIVEFRSLRTQTTGTDQNDRYTAHVPRSRVYLWAEGPSEVEQPCVATAAIDIREASVGGKAADYRLRL
jgi:hypothetical protein